MLKTLLLRYAQSLLLLIVVTSYFLMSLLPDFRTALPEFLGVTAVIVLTLYLIMYTGEQGAVSWSPSLIMAVAAVLRLLFLFRPAELSDDIYRYLWDGLQMFHGHNPYLLAPADVRPVGAVLPELLRHVNHGDLVTIYPPAAQIIFLAGAALHKSVAGIKAVIIILDLATCLVIMRLLRRLHLPVWRGVLYAWNPLAVIETAASGHIDTAGLLFFLASFLWMLRASADACGSPAEGPVSPPSRFPWMFLVSGAFFSAAVLVKLVPLIFFPGLVLLAGRRGRLLFIIGFVSGLLMLALPFLPGLMNMFDTLRIYAQNWEFSGLAFRSIRAVLLSGVAARILLLSVFIAFCFFLYIRLRRGSSSESDIRKNVPLAFYLVSLSFLICTPTLHPWYVLSLLIFVPFTAGTSGLALSWSIFFAYYVLIPYFYLGRWVENHYVPFLVWSAPLCVYILSMLAGRIALILTKPRAK